jgi:hypothetical protein
VVEVRIASQEDLPAILRPYAQPDLDDGAVLPIPEAERIFERMSRYPDYKLYVAVRDEGVVGKEMMRQALRLAGEHGCYKAALSSNLKRERAHAFYDSLGFERHGYSFRVDTSGHSS